MDALPSRLPTRGPLNGHHYLLGPVQIKLRPCGYWGVRNLISGFCSADHGPRLRRISRTNAFFCHVDEILMENLGWTVRPYFVGFEDIV